MTTTRMRMGLAVLLVTFGAGLQGALAADSASHGPRLVMIIRHGEKPDNSGVEKDPNLSKQGYERAEALAKVMPEHFPKPDFLIASKRSKNSNRPVETLTPLAKALHEEIDISFADTEFDQLAHAVLTDPKYEGKVVLIAWHHGEIPALAKALGVKDAPAAWDPKVFDRVWEISYDEKGASWKEVSEKALPGDAEKQ